MMEALTDDMYQRALALVNEVEAMGGMAKAVASGMPKLRIEQAAAQRQARIDAGYETIVGVNKYQCDADDAVEVLSVDNSAVRASQLVRLAAVRKSRSSDRVAACLGALRRCAETGSGNLLALSVNAAQERCTVGEISHALEEAWGRHEPKSEVVSGAYLSSFGRDEGEIQRTICRAQVSRPLSAL